MKINIMLTNNFGIVPYNEVYRQTVLEIWERSVIATHNFLTQSDFEEIKCFVKTIDFIDLQVFCLKNNDFVIGFIALANKKIEMLFLDPEYFGQGLGQKLLSFAVNEMYADTLDVNEQNVKALKFYNKFGFETYERSDKDDQGRNYPILRMKYHENK
jgi:putative acetyltransferase